ncbi:MAG: peptide chain release factor 2 [Deltaproteobacteria bacterium]|nr:peptide chain release factor 2 [Deltaproteobacteria bacterium]
MADRKEILKDLQSRFDILRRHLDLEALARKLAEFDHDSQNPQLWQDAQKAAEHQRERAKVSSQLELYGGLDKKLTDVDELLELAAQDNEIAVEVDDTLTNIKTTIEKMELERMLSGQYDALNAIVSINAGAGGTESQDWVQMLLRMLLRWAEHHDFEYEMLDTLPGDEAGLKSASFSVMGTNAYGYLRGESGVHRLVRISPFDANKRRHTSFASIAVAPEIDDSIEVNIRDEDLRVDTYRSGGAGGQHVNKTDSAVRLTHIPTGIVVACQAERSQHKNKSKAMKMLRAKIFERELRAKEEERAKIAGEKKKIEWGSQIRSYVLQPYRMVKDHRTGLAVGNTDAVLDGDLDNFIEAYLLGRTPTSVDDEADDL